MFLCTKAKVSDGDSNYNLTYVSSSHFKRNIKLTLKEKNNTLL